MKSGVAALCGLLISLPLAAQSLNDTFARLDKTAPVFRSYEAVIHRVVHTAVINDDAADQGIIRVKRDKKNTRMLIDFNSPEAKTVAIENATVSIYYPKIKTVQIFDLSDKRNLIDQFLLLGFGATSAELKASYEVNWVGVETVGGQPGDHIFLTPKTPDVQKQLKRADLWISANGLPLQQKATTSTSGDYELATYLNARLNPSLSDSSLKLDYPKGVQIQHPGK